MDRGALKTYDNKKNSLLTSGSQVRVPHGSPLKSSTYGHHNDARFALHTLSHTHSAQFTQKSKLS